MTPPVLIGLTADHEPRASGATEAEYVLRANYTQAITEAGGVPVLLPHHPDKVAAYVDLLDGIVITGGMFDIDPAYYAGAPDPTLKTKPVRTAFEWALLKAALQADLAVLGICNGMQLLAVQLGGALVADIQRDVPGGRDHLLDPVPDTPAHRIEITPRSRLFSVYGQNSARVNSLHHQAVTEGDGYIIAARSQPDHVPEAIEATRHRYAMGLQWHPEYKTSPLDQCILSDFVAAAAATPKTGDKKDGQRNPPACAPV